MARLWLCDKKYNVADMYAANASNTDNVSMIADTMSIYLAFFALSKGVFVLLFGANILMVNIAVNSEVKKRSPLSTTKAINVACFSSTILLGTAKLPRGVRKFKDVIVASKDAATKYAFSDFSTPIMLILR